MKMKKSIISVIGIVAIMTFVMIANFTNLGTYASDSKILNVIGNREGNEVYKITNLDPQKTIWKIVSYDSLDDTATPNYNEAIYCLTPEQGFGSEATAEPGKKQYDVSFNMKDLSTVDEKYKSLFGDTSDVESFNTTYNSILWILDNMYLPKQLPENQKETVKEILYKKAKIEDSKLTDNDIEAVQQMALWYFTSTSDKYHFEPENFPSISINDTAIEEIGKPLTSDGIQRYEDMKLLYTYFITSAKENANAYGTGDIRELDTPIINVTNPANTELVDYTIDGTIYSIAGPYNFTEVTGTKLPYILNGRVIDQNSAEISDYKLLDGNKQIISDATITEALLGQDFYIAIPKSNTTVTEIKLEIETKYFETKTTAWTNSTTYSTEQLVVIVDREPKKEFDLALRKFITKIDDKNIVSRVPNVDVTGLKNGTSTTAIYTHSKEPLTVKTGSKVTYTIRVYNEGEEDGYVEEITDDIPEGLKFLPDDPTNIEYMWKLSSDGTKISTNYLSKQMNEDNIIKGFNKEIMGTLDYKDVQIVFEVTEPNSSDRVITNTAEISKDAGKDGNDVIDRDSTPGNNDENEDDLDKEHIILEPPTLTNFDLALRKFITKVNNQSISPSREPVVDISGLIDGTKQTAIYTHPKTPVGVQIGDTVIYTIRVYNEGNIDGYAEEITDYIPEGLEFISQEDSSINNKYQWILSEDGKKITTNYLSEANSNKESTNKEENFLIKAFDKTTENPSLDYRDVQVEMKVIAANSTDGTLRNIAEISEDSNEDFDSTPDNVDIDNYTPPTDNSEYQEDDDDYEDLIMRYFDLALRKFITKVNEEEINTRYPEVSLNEEGKIVYTHTKDPILVANNDIVIYTIRVYNEGKEDGYAKEITDDIPLGLNYLPEHEINKKFEWVISEDGKKVSTNYLSKESSEKRGEDNLIKAFDETKYIIDEEGNRNPDYRDVQIAFKVTEKNLNTDRIIINTAEITDDSDSNGNDIKDEDSIPNNGVEDEDDIDKEYLQVKYFDLSLLKWVSKVYVTENGNTSITETGHTGLEKPEPIVKVDLNRKEIDKVTVKFGYVIKITNEGQIAGYATEISDYIPEGLEFLPEDNPDWEEIEGKIITTKLADTLLQPGESATVEVILTWINDSENMGVKTNVAEISKDDNENDAEDIDSTPNNQKEGEDDIDDAPVMLAVTTGGETTYIILSTVILVMFGTGIFMIKKYVLD